MPTPAHGGEGVAGVDAARLDASFARRRTFLASIAPSLVPDYDQDTFQSMTTVQQVNMLLNARSGINCTQRVSKFYSVIGIIAALVVLPAVVIQISSIVSQKSACSISYWYLAGLWLTNAIWLVYSLGNDIYVSALSFGLAAFITAVIIGLKARYDTDGHCPNSGWELGFTPPDAEPLLD